MYVTQTAFINLTADISSIFEPLFNAFDKNLDFLFKYIQNFAFSPLSPLSDSVSSIDSFSSTSSSLCVELSNEAFPKSHGKTKPKSEAIQ